MKIASNHLEAFSAVARHLSFSKGAKSIHVTQSAVSQRIAALEEELGVALFIRERALLRLTSAGEKLLRYSQSQEQLESELLSDLRVREGKTSNLQGEVRIAGFSSIARSAIVPALAPLLQANTDLGFSIVTKEIPDLLSTLRSGEVDFVVTNKNPERNDIEAIYLGLEENVLVESKKYPNNSIYLDHDAQGITTNSYFKNKEVLRMRFVDDVYGLIDGVRCGLGRAVLPKHLIQNEKEFVILNRENVLRVKLYLLFYKQPHYSKLQQLVVKQLQGYFKTHF